MLVKNIFLIVFSLSSLVMVGVIMVTGWIGVRDFVIQMSLLAIFVGLVIWDLWDRPSHDPVRKFFRRLLGRWQR